MLSNRCPLCEHPHARHVATLADGVKVLRCLRCRLVRTDPLPSIGSGSSGTRSVLTSEDYTAGMVSNFESRRPFYGRLALQRHRRYSESLGRKTYRLLEIGCGVAGLAEGFRSVGVEYSGLDLDERPIDFASSRGVSGVRVGDFMDEEPTEHFDVVACSQVLEHIKTPAEFILKIGRSLRPGGVLHLDVPNHDSLAGG